MNSRGICLVIEGDLGIREMLVLILSGMGFEVGATAAGAAGIRAAKALDRTLTTLDIGLSDISGRDIARSLRPRPSDELDGRDAGATAYLTKPFRPVQLRELVQELCSLRSPRQRMMGSVVSED